MAVPEVHMTVAGSKRRAIDLLDRATRDMRSKGEAVLAIPGDESEYQPNLVLRFVDDVDHQAEVPDPEAPVVVHFDRVEGGE